jgi:hypothetical protein
MLPHGWIVHHSPNQGHGRSAKQGGILKAMGTQAGFPDLVILGPAYAPGSPVYFVEVKDPAKGHDLSNAQEDFHDALMDLGYLVGTVTSIDEMRLLARKWGLPIREVNGVAA